MGFSWHPDTTNLPHQVGGAAAATIQTSDPQSMPPSQPPSREVGDIHQPNELFVLFIKVRAWNRNIHFLQSNDLCGFTLESNRYDDFLTDLPVYLSNAKSSLVQTLSNDIIQTILSSYVKVNEMSSILSPSRDGWGVWGVRLWCRVYVSSNRARSLRNFH